MDREFDPNLYPALSTDDVDDYNWSALNGIDTEAIGRYEQC